MTNYEKYFSTPERAALTLCDLEKENQFFTRHVLRTSIEPVDEDNKPKSFDQIIEEVMDYAPTPILVLFDWLDCAYFIGDEIVKKDYTFVPTSAHKFLQWLQEECDE